MSKAGTEGIIALLHERDTDHCAVLMLVAGMQDSLPEAIARLDRVLDFQREYRAALSGNRREHRQSIRMTDRAIDLGRSLLDGLHQVHQVGAERTAGMRTEGPERT